jgi:hypothetical protein
MAAAHLGRGEPPAALRLSVPQARLSPATQGRHGGRAAEGERFRSPSLSLNRLRGCGLV